MQKETENSQVSHYHKNEILISNPGDDYSVKKEMTKWINSFVTDIIENAVGGKEWDNLLTGYGNEFKILDYATKRSIEIATNSKIIEPLSKNSCGSYSSVFLAKDKSGNIRTVKLFKELESAKAEFRKNLWVRHLTSWNPLLDFHEVKLDNNKKIGIHFYYRFLLEDMGKFFSFLSYTSKNKKEYPQGASKYIGFEMDDNLPKEMLIRFFVYQIIVALKYAYNSGVGYTDLKPNNIFISGNGFSYIGDSGGACNFTYDLVYLDKIQYTTAYFPLAKEEVDAKTFRPEDIQRYSIFSLGAIIYELYTSELFLDQKKDEAVKRDNKQKAIKAGLEKIKKDKNMTDELKKFLLFIFEEHPSFDDLLNHPWMNGPNNDYLNFIKKSLIELGYTGPVRPTNAETVKYRKEVLNNLLAKDFFDYQSKNVLSCVETVDSKQLIDNLDDLVPESIDDVDISKIEALVNKYNQNDKKLYLNDNSLYAEKKIKDMFIYDKYGYLFGNELIADKTIELLNNFVADMERFVHQSDQWHKILAEIKQYLKNENDKNSTVKIITNCIFLSRDLLSNFEKQIKKWVKMQRLDKSVMDKISEENKKILTCLGKIYKVTKDSSTKRSFAFEEETLKEMTFCAQIKKYFEARKQELEDNQKESDKHNTRIDLNNKVPDYQDNTKNNATILDFKAKKDKSFKFKKMLRKKTRRPKSMNNYNETEKKVKLRSA